MFISRIDHFVNISTKPGMEIALKKLFLHRNEFFKFLPQTMHYNKSIQNSAKLKSVSMQTISDRMQFWLSCLDRKMQF